MKVIKCGTTVVTKIGNVKAIISAVIIRSGRVAYELSWFTEGKHFDTCVTEDEFTIENGTYQTIGFKQNINP